MRASMCVGLRLFVAVAVVAVLSGAAAGASLRHGRHTAAHLYRASRVADHVSASSQAVRRVRLMGLSQSCSEASEAVMAVANVKAAVEEYETNVTYVVLPTPCALTSDGSILNHDQDCMQTVTASVAKQAELERAVQAAGGFVTFYSIDVSFKTSATGDSHSHHLINTDFTILSSKCTIADAEAIARFNAASHLGYTFGNASTTVPSAESSVRYSDACGNSLTFTPQVSIACQLALRSSAANPIQSQAMIDITNRATLSNTPVGCDSANWTKPCVTALSLTAADQTAYLSACSQHGGRIPFSCSTTKDAVQSTTQADEKGVQQTMQSNYPDCLPLACTDADAVAYYTYKAQETVDDDSQSVASVIYSGCQHTVTASRKDTPVGGFSSPATWKASTCSPSKSEQTPAPGGKNSAATLRGLTSLTPVALGLALWAVVRAFSAQC